MRLPIRLTLVIGLILAVSSLVLGALVPLPGPKTSNSPYLSTLSDMAVKSAEAVPCYTYCFRAHPHDPWQCVDCFPCNTVCQKVGTDQCNNISPPPGSCPLP
ncbi:MAG TPA: hypothetical protein VGQ14_04480 [Candidatus Eisenbacteria bacterium]|jgi:hypothetical protein|nr:hypothetical protein [Candidatus Eisenbacteria bacterium]